MMNGYYGGMGGGTGWGGWVLMAVLMVAFWGVVVYAIVALFRSGPTPGTGPDAVRPADPGRILDERFARGEIELEEYQARKDALVGASLKHR